MQVECTSPCLCLSSAIYVQFTFTHMDNLLRPFEEVLLNGKEAELGADLQEVMLLLEWHLIGNHLQTIKRWSRHFRGDEERWTADHKLVNAEAAE